MAMCKLMIYSHWYGKLIVAHHMGNFKINYGIYFVNSQHLFLQELSEILNQNICSRKSSEPDTLIMFFFISSQNGFTDLLNSTVHLAMKTLVNLVFWRYLDT